MFLTSSLKPIDPPLKELVEQIEQQSPAISVLAARQFLYFVEQTPVEVTIAEPRKYNILEEFVLRSGVELDPAPTVNELANIFKIDSIFVQNTVKTLQNLQTLTSEQTEQIILTPEGVQFYQQGSVPQPPQIKQIYAIADPLNNTLRFVLNPIKSASIEVINLQELLPLEQKIQKLDALSLEEIQSLVQTSGLALHIPEEGKMLTSSKITATPQKIAQAVSIFVVYDALEDKITLQARKGKKVLAEASTWLNHLLTEKQISCNTLCQLSDNAIATERQTVLELRNEQVEARLNAIEEMALNNLKKEQESNNSENSNIQLLRDSKIREAFLSTLRSATSNILIYSPWVSDAVVDKEFLKLLQTLANRGVWILIGHGISRREEDEDRPIPPEVEEKLKAIKTPEGLSAVQVFWLGNSHAKEIIVDKKVHLCGSHNWLSYRGDWLPRGETVYQVTLPEQVEEAYAFLSRRFQAHAETLWAKAFSNNDASLAISSFCIWGALGMEEFALQQLQQKQSWALFPYWLKVVHQGLRSKQVLPESACLVKALSVLSEVSEKDSQLEPLQQAWRKVMGAIASQNKELALQLLNQEVWLSFTRLGIAQSTIDSPSNFIAQYSPKKEPKKTTPTKQKSI